MLYFSFGDIGKKVDSTITAIKGRTNPEID